MTPHEKLNSTVYVLGFAFSHTMRSVVLIEKQKPAWQAGKLNGVGGKVERGETAEDAICREVAEETGVTYTCHRDWLYIMTMRFQNGAIIHVYTTKLIEGTEVRTMEVERVDVYPVDDFGHLRGEFETIRNLNWLIPLCYHQLTEPPQERMLTR